ncbi:MAG TPA: PepSY domain-containing protein [Steroidobacteraceae bacterium]|jgi:uncharacterized membrane protein YkoI|nr:PepSY domain-containing protein [Steroidobacteraceae bacterium]
MKLTGAVLILRFMLCGGGLLAAGAALAASANEAMTMSQAVKMVEQRYHASVVKAETQKQGERTVYALRLFNRPAGKVWTVRVDAASGAVL